MHCERCGDAGELANDHQGVRVCPSCLGESAVPELPPEAPEGVRPEPSDKEMLDALQKAGHVRFVVVEGGFWHEWVRQSGPSLDLRQYIAATMREGE